MKHKRDVIVFFTTILVLSGLILQAHAAGVVTDCSKFGLIGDPGTFAAAISGGGDVTFACNGTIIVPSKIDIEIDTKIDANGHDVILTSVDEVISSIFWNWEGITLDLIGLKFIGGKFIYGAIRNLGGVVTISDSLILENTAAGNVAGIRNENWDSYTGQMTLIKTTVSKNTVIAETATYAGGIYNSGEMSLVDSTISENSALTLLGVGTSVGGIRNSGALTIFNSTISQNRGGSGGGISNSGNMELQDSRIVNNIAESSDTVSGNGGAINAIGYSVIIITNSEISGNTATNRGGGIYSYDGDIYIENTTISNNHSQMGGGILASTSSILTISNSTLSGNIADTNGGGLYNLNIEGQTTISNTTFSGNSAVDGGGIRNYSSTLTLANVTLYGNSATATGSNLSGNIIQMSNTLIAGATGALNCNILESNLIDNGYNLSDDDSCIFISTTSRASTVSGLDATLADNGGLTQTHALLSDSPALNVIPYGTNGCGDIITTDQRGISRPQEELCDIGAYELEAIVDDQPPVINNVEVTPNLTVINSPVNITATVDDSTTGGSNILSAEYTVDGVEWMPLAAADEAFDSPVEQATVEVFFTEPKAYSVCVRGTDTFSNMSTVECTDLTVQQPITNSIHVESIDGVIKVGKKLLTFTASVKVTDGNNNPVRGVTVSAAITNQENVSNVTATTSRTGIATFKATSSVSGWLICVTKLESSKYTYDPGADKETCDSF